jgi:uncharacterized membrane protein YkvA (DUF1232 family)
MKVINKWKEWTKRLKLEVHAIYLAQKDPRVPWYAKLLAAFFVGYALNPMDLIPDPIPVLGYLDDLILVPLGIALVVKMIPPEVMAECREKAQAHANQNKTKNWFAAVIIIAIWVLLAVWAVILIARAVRNY